MEVGRLADLKQRLIVLYERGETIGILLVGDTKELNGKIYHVGDDYISLEQEGYHHLIPMDKIKLIKLPRK